MIKTVLVEDESANVRIFRKMLENYCPQVEIIGVAGTVNDAFALLKKETPDLVFLDIELPGGNAFTLLDKLKPVAFEVIFVTAYDNYTLKAIKYSALDYLLKPVNIEELILAVNNVSEKLQTKQFQQRIQHFLYNIDPSKKGLQSLAVPVNFGFEFVSINNIIRCEANGKFTNFFMHDGNKMISIKNLKEYESILPQDVFFRIHHSHLININFVKRYHKMNSIVEMEDGIKIPLALRRKKDFLSIFSEEE